MTHIVDTQLITAHNTMTQMLQGNVSKQEVIEFLKDKSGTSLQVPELSAYLSAIKSTAKITINADHYSLPVVEISGTGGDQLNTVNISTLASIVASASDEVVVCKYGNRSASGVCGSMDVLEAVGIPIQAELNTQTEFKFIPLFARSVYPGARNVALARKEYGKPSIFNLLFPLARPIVGPFSLVMGFAQESMMELSAQILKNEPVKALLIHGMDGSDEISVANSGVTHYYLVDNGNITQGEININSLLDIAPVDITLLQIATKQQAVKLFTQVFDLSVTTPQLQAIRTSVAVNAAAVLTLAYLDSQENFDAAFASNYDRVLDILNSGKASQRFIQLQGRK